MASVVEVAKARREVVLVVPAVAGAEATAWVSAGRKVAEMDCAGISRPSALLNIESE